MLKAQEDVAGGQKRDVEEEEDPYNGENLQQVSSPADPDPEEQRTFYFLSRDWGETSLPLIVCFVSVGGTKKSGRP